MAHDLAGAVAIPWGHDLRQERNKEEIHSLQRIITTYGLICPSMDSAELCRIDNETVSFESYFSTSAIPKAWKGNKQLTGYIFNH